MTAYEISVIIVLVATMIAILIAPVLGAIAEARLKQPKVTSLPKQPVTRRPTKADRVQRVLGAAASVILLLSMGIDIYWIRFRWGSSAPITNKSVLVSALLVAWFFMLCLIALIRFVVDRLLAIIVAKEQNTTETFVDVLDLIRDLNNRTTDSFEKVMDVFQLVSQFLHRVEKRLPQDKLANDAPLLDKMLAGLKKLMAKSKEEYRS